jgi:hypothetical protein
MKKQLLIVAGVVGIAVVAVFAQTAAVSVWSDYLGLHIGAKATDKVSFRNATPVVKSTITNTAPVLAALTLYTQTQIITNVFPADTTNVFTVVSVTNVAINAIAGYSGTNQLNAVRNCLVNHGLASTDGN